MCNFVIWNRSCIKDDVNFSSLVVMVFVGWVLVLSISFNELKFGRLGINFLEIFDVLFLFKVDLDLK